MKERVRYISILEYDFSIKQFIDLGFVIDVYKLPGISPYKKAAIKAVKSIRGSIQISHKNSYSRGDIKIREAIEKAIVERERIPKSQEIYIACLYFPSIKRVRK